MSVRFRRILLAALVPALSLACETLFPVPPTTTSLASTAVRPATETHAAPAVTPTSTELPERLPAPTFAPNGSSLQRQAMRPEFVGDVDAVARAPRYLVEATFRPGDPATLIGRQRVRYTNASDEALTDIAFNLYVNTPQFLGRITVDAAAVDGRPATPAFPERSVLVLPLDAPLEPGESIDVELSWSETIERGTEGGFYRYGETRGVYSMPSFVPLVARRLDGRWDAGDQAFTGDPVTSEAAFFQVQITAPEALATVASGTLISTRSSGDDTITYTFVTGPMRDVALVLGPLERRERSRDGVKINLWLLQEHVAQAEAIFQVAEDSLRTFGEQIGPYPYNEADYVDIPGFGGIEFPGLMIIGTVGNARAQEVVIAHETGHQWFYGLIGDDQLQEPWLDEGLTSYLEVLYFQAVYGDEGRQGALELHARDFARGAQHPELPVGLAVDDYPSAADYFSVVYDKSVFFLEELRQTIGDEDFEALLRGLYNAYKYGMLTTEAFHALAETTCTCDLDALFELWVTEGGPVEMDLNPH